LGEPSAMSAATIEATCDIVRNWLTELAAAARAGHGSGDTPVTSP